MSTTTSTTKAKPDKQNLTRTKSLGSKPKPSEDGSDQKPEKPLPNYLKPTISSRPDPVKFLKKNNSSLDDDNQKLLRRRSFDRPPSSFTSPSTSSSQRRKSLNVSPSLSRDRPAVPREKSVTALRSSSFHGSRNVPKGGSSTTTKSPHVVPKKSSSLKSKKEGSANVTETKEITLDSASLSSAKEDHEEEDLKVENDVDKEEPKVNKEVEVDVVQADQEDESGGLTTVVLPVEEDCIPVVSKDNEEEVKNKIDEDDETPKKDNESVEETTEEEVKEEEKEKEEVKQEEEEKEKGKEEEESEEGKKREVVKAPSAYNDVIASKMQENPRKNKVLALAGAFQTVIDYETAASK